MRKATLATTKASSSSRTSVPRSVTKARSKITRAVSAAETEKDSKQQTWLTKLQSSHLKRLAFLTGQPSAGTKPTLSGLLADSLVKPRLPFPNARILSVDMGVKNLGVCLLEVNGLRKWKMFDDDIDHDSSASTISSTAGPSHYTMTRGLSDDDVDDGNADVDSGGPAIKILEWTRLDLSHRLIQLALKGTKDSGHAANLFAGEAAAVAVGKDKAHHQIYEGPMTEEDDNDQIDVNTSSQSSSSVSQQANIYTPSHLSKVAYVLASQFVAYRPDVILIERQRFRSGGAPAIQEWTVRVNMLESMLWAALETMKHARVEHGSDNQSLSGSTSSKVDNGRPKGSISDGGKIAEAITATGTFPDVVEMSPRRIGSFWLTALEEQEAKKVPQGGDKTVTVMPPKDVVTQLEVDSDGDVASTSVKKTDIKRRAFEKKDKISLVRHWLSEADEMEDKDADDNDGRTGSNPNTLAFDKRVWPVVSVFRRLTSPTTTKSAATKDMTKKRGSRAKKNKETATDDDGDNINNNANGTKNANNNKNSHDEHSMPAVSSSSTRPDAASSALSDPYDSSEQPMQQQALTRPGKLDDLADCLVQGVTFALWEENRRRLSFRHHLSSSSKQTEER